MLPASHTNAVADDRRAASLGRALFFDKGMSSEGTVACASCHIAEEGWSDDRAVSEGVFGRTGTRHSMPVATAAFQPFLLWDGRADSLWSQALLAIENPDEMDFSRIEVVRHLAANYEETYVEVFGPLPEVDTLPSAGLPGQLEWERLSEDEREQINTAFANAGKALEAFERKVSCTDTRFDRWVGGQVEMTRREEVGAARFLRDGCVDCHSGPRFSDGDFHNIGIGSGTAQPDPGRYAGVSLLLANPFNGEGRDSDDPAAGARRLAGLEAVDKDLGAFRTPTLRGVAQRRGFGHRGHIGSLEDFIDDIYDDPTLHGTAVGDLDPLVRDVEANREARIVDFLRMLDCPPTPAELEDPRL